MSNRFCDMQSQHCLGACVTRVPDTAVSGTGRDFWCLRACRVSNRGYSASSCSKVSLRVPVRKTVQIRRSCFCWTSDLFPLHFDDGKILVDWYNYRTRKFKERKDVVCSESMSLLGIYAETKHNLIQTFNGGKPTVVSEQASIPTAI